MNFKYQVQPTVEVTPGLLGFPFMPSELEVIVENKEMLVDGNGNPFEVVNLHTILTEYMADGTGTVKQDRMIKMPMSIVNNMFAGFDAAEMKPVIAIPALQSILYSYKLGLK